MTWPKESFKFQNFKVRESKSQRSNESRAGWDFLFLLKAGEQDVRSRLPLRLRRFLMTHPLTHSKGQLAGLLVRFDDYVIAV